MNSKKIAVISSIHANIYALRSFLAYIDSCKDIEYIINLGNFIEDGPNPCEVFDAIMEDKRFINILGEREYSLLEGNENHGGSGDIISYEEWVKEKLGKHRLEILEKMKESKPIELQIANKKFLLVYAQHRSFPPDYPMVAHFIKGNNVGRLALDPETVLNYDYILYGHEFIQSASTYAFPSSAMTDKHIKIISPGSANFFKDNSVNFSIFDFNEEEFNVYFRKIKYDMNKLVEDLYISNVPGKEPILHRYYGIENIDKVLEKSEILKPFIKLEGNLMINVNKCDKNYNPIIPSEFWLSIINLFIKKCKFIYFGCWKGEEAIINEIQECIEDITIEREENGQVFLGGNLTGKAVKLITESFYDGTGKLKWFDIGLGNSSIDKMLFGSSHYGSELYLNNLCKEDLKFIKSILPEGATYHVS